VANTCLFQDEAQVFSRSLERLYTNAMSTVVSEASCKASMLEGKAVGNSSAGFFTSLPVGNDAGVS
jgi:hypothetical protein